MPRNKDKERPAPGPAFTGIEGGESSFVETDTPEETSFFDSVASSQAVECWQLDKATNSFAFVGRYDKETFEKDPTWIPSKYGGGKWKMRLINERGNYEKTFYVVFSETAFPPPAKALASSSPAVAGVPARQTDPMIQIFVPMVTGMLGALGKAMERTAPPPLDPIRLMEIMDRMRPAPAPAPVSGVVAQPLGDKIGELKALMELAKGIAGGESASTGESPWWETAVASLAKIVDSPRIASILSAPAPVTVNPGTNGKPRNVTPKNTGGVAVAEKTVVESPADAEVKRIKNSLAYTMFAPAFVSMFQNHVAVEDTAKKICAVMPDNEWTAFLVQLERNDLPDMAIKLEPATFDNSAGREWLEKLVPVLRATAKTFTTESGDSE